MSIVLNKKQILKLAEIVNKFNLERLTLEVDHSSGIGQSVVAKFGFFEENDGKFVFDITDVGDW